MKKAKPEQNYLVVFKGNWADEMDIEGFSVMDGESKDAYFNDIKKWFKTSNESYQYNIGTNEYIEYDSFEDFKSNFTIKKITEEQADLLWKLDIPHGFFPRWSWVMVSIPLKDCPFCGGKSDKENRDLNKIYFDTKCGWYWVYCEECGCRTAHAGNEKAAATLWNTRAYEKK